MTEDDLLRHAERDVIEAAETWETEQRKATREPSSASSQQLRAAVYALRRARRVTGKIRVEDVRDEIEKAKR